MKIREVTRLHFIEDTLFYKAAARNNNPSVVSGTCPVFLMGIRFQHIRHFASCARLASAILDFHTIGASLAVCYVCVFDQKAKKWQWKQVLDASRGSALDPADDIFWPTPDQNRQRVVCAQFCELCHFPYTLMLLMVYCIRRKRSCSVTNKICAHVVEETSGGQTEGKQKVVAKPSD